MNLARELIAQFDGLLGATHDGLLTCIGVGIGKNALLKAVRELGRRALAEH